VRVWFGNLNWAAGNVRAKPNHAKSARQRDVFIKIKFSCSVIMKYAMSQANTTHALTPALSHPMGEGELSSVF
jgi:hypothetical protein